MSIFTVSPKDIEDWSTRYDAPALFPLLIKKLLCTTSKTLSYLDVRYMECNNQPGYDAIVEDLKGCRNWVPKGRSCWEFGDAQKMTTKANEDYNKRTKDSLGENKSAVTLVFATPKIWPARAEWEKAKNKEGIWKKVIAIDAQVLANWIDECPSVKFWFMELSGKRRDDIESLDSCWEEWSNYSEPALPAFLFENVQRECSGLFNSWLNEKQGAIFTIAAESPLEGLAFVYQLAQNDTISQKGKNFVYVKSIEAFKTIKNLYTSVDVICVVTDRLIAAQIYSDRDNLKILQIVPPSLFEQRDNVDDISYRMSLIDKACVDRLRKEYAGVHWEEKVKEAGYSRTVLRRRIAKNRMAVPKWAEEIQHTKLLLALALIGPWTETNIGGRKLLASMTGQSVDDCSDALMTLAGMPDSPVWVLDGTYGLLSPIECLETIRSSIKKTNLEIFLNHVRHWSIASNEQYSRNEKQSIFRGLYMLCSWARVWFPDHKQWFLSEVKTLGKDILQHIFDAKREDLFFMLRMIAEILPDTYLTFLSEIKVDKDNDFFHKAYLGDTYDGIEDSLYMLAIPSQYFAKVIDLLCLWYGNADADIQDKISDSLLDFLDARLPQTNADYITRKAAYEKVIALDRKLAWKLCVAILKGKRSIAYWDRVKWRGRDWKLSNRASIYESQANEICLAAYDRLFREAHWGYRNIQDMLDCVSVLGVELQDKLFTRLLNGKYNLTDSELLILQEKIREYVFQQKRRKDSKREFSYLALLFTRKYAPADIVLNYAWLFRYNIWWRMYLDEDYESAEKKKFSIRLWAFRRLWKNQGIGVLKLLTLEHVDVIDFSKCVVEHLSVDNIVTVIKALCGRDDVTCETKKSCICYIILNMDDDDVGTTITQLHALLTPADFLNVMESLPSHHVVRRTVIERGIMGEKAYWKHVRVGGCWLTYSPDVEYHTIKLMENGRSLEAICSLEHCMDDVPKDLLRSVVLRIVQGYLQEGKMTSQVRYATFKALKRLGKLSAFSQLLLAKIELILYTELNHMGYDCSALRKQVIEQPVFLAMLMEIALRRGVLADIRIFGVSAENISSAAWLFLRDGCTFSPDNEARSALMPKLSDWLYSLQTIAQRRHRTPAFMSFCGEILAKYGIKQEGWPVKEICEAVELYFCDSMASGFHVGIFNSRGLVCKPEETGGVQERSLSRKYKGIASRLKAQYPHIASIIAVTAESYFNIAKMYDKEEWVTKRC